MTEFLELSPYKYFEPTPEKTELNVGWINTENPFPASEPSSDFLDKLWNFCRRAFMQSRGLYECDKCARQRKPFLKDGRFRTDNFHIFKHLGDEKVLGSAEIRVFGKNDIIYCAPDLIFHYVRDHKYSPPKEFIEAVTSGPHPGGDKYLKLSENYNCQDKWLDKLS